MEPTRRCFQEARETVENMSCHHTSRNGKEVSWIRGFTAVQTWLRGKHFSARNRRHARKTTGILSYAGVHLEGRYEHCVVTAQFLFFTRAVSLSFELNSLPSSSSLRHRIVELSRAARIPNTYAPRRSVSASRRT